MGTAFSGAVVVPAVIDGKPVVGIADGAFSDFDMLERITFPSGLEGIGADAFSGCDLLTGVKFPATLTTFGSGAFSDCSQLLEANFTGDEPSSVGENVFAGAHAGFSIHYQESRSRLFLADLARISHISMVY